MSGSPSRADLGFGDALESFDPDAWAVRPARRSAPDAETARRHAETLGFPSRAPAPLQDAPQAAPVVAAPAAAGAAARPVRRRRTGRNAQFNLKAKPETIEAYCEIADHMGWGLGETLEYAVALLQERYGPKR